MVVVVVGKVVGKVVDVVVVDVEVVVVVVVVVVVEVVVMVVVVGWSGAAGCGAGRVHPRFCIPEPNDLKFGAPQCLTCD